MKINVKVLPQNVEIVVPAGVSLRYALSLIPNVEFSLPCGGKGICGKCKVRFIRGAPVPTEAEKRLLSKKELEKGIRLLCQAILSESCVVELAVYDVAYNIPPMPEISFPRDLAEKCEGNNLYLAVDVGTTTISALLIKNSQEQGFSFINPQIKTGADVISRVDYCLKNGTRSLKDMLISKISSVLNGMDVEKVCFCAFSGNTVMQGILKEEELFPLSRAPYTKGKREGIIINLKFSEKGAYILPEIGGFLGGDALSLILAARSYTTSFLALDIGTNTEIILSSDDGLWGSSVPAGPALEGQGISCGVCAIEGAVCDIGNDFELITIKNAKPIGFCGSGFVGALYILKKQGFLEPSGRLKNGKFSFSDELYITQRDVRQFQLAKAAVYAGVKTLAEKTGVYKVEKIFISGNFGGSLKKEWLSELKFFPQLCDDIFYLGNTSLWGAKWALLSSSVRKKLEVLKDEAKLINLAEEENFQEAFLEGMEI